MIRISFISFISLKLILFYLDKLLIVHYAKTLKIALFVVKNIIKAFISQYAVHIIVDFQHVKLVFGLIFLELLLIHIV